MPAGWYISVCQRVVVIIKTPSGLSLRLRGRGAVAELIIQLHLKLVTDYYEPGSNSTICFSAS